MNQTSASVAMLYGASGTYKTTQIAQAAEYVYEQTGRHLRVVSAESAGVDPLAPYIDAKLIELIKDGDTIDEMALALHATDFFLYQRLYAPLTAAIRAPDPSDLTVLSHRQTKLDRLYVAVDEALHKLADHVGLTA